MTNKRLEDMLRKIVPSGIPEGLYLLDCFMGRTIRQDYSHAITTRTATDNNTFVMIVMEYGEDNAHAKGDA